MTQPKLTALTSATVFTGEAFIEGQALLLQNSQVIELLDPAKLPKNCEVLPCDGNILAPGLIDCQVNGGGNILFNAADNATMVVTMAKAHARMGTTRLLPTFISDKPTNAQRALILLREARRLFAGILGIHFEGPHLGTEARGVHKIDNLRHLNPDDLVFYKPGPSEIIMVTLAPERATPELINGLAAQGTIVALGHSLADSASIKTALKAGVTGFSHLYNGMGGIEARRPGLAGIALDDREGWCSLIADGHHVCAELIRLACRAKPTGKVMLISDAMPPAGADNPKAFSFFGDIIQVDVEKGRCTTSGGRLAGAAVTLASCVRHAIKKVGIDPAEALRMASAYPAAFLGLTHHYGKLLPGFTADIVMFDQDYNVKGAWVGGEKQ